MDKRTDRQRRTRKEHIFCYVHTNKWASACYAEHMSCSDIKHGRIHGYPSRVRVGRGSDEIDQLGSWAGAVTPKPPINAKKAKCYRPTGGPTDRAGCRVAYHATKNTNQHTNSLAWDHSFSFSCFPTLLLVIYGDNVYLSHSFHYKIGRELLMARGSVCQWWDWLMYTAWAYVCE